MKKTLILILLVLTGLYFFRKKKTTDPAPSVETNKKPLSPVENLMKPIEKVVAPVVKPFEKVIKPAEKVIEPVVPTPVKPVTPVEKHFPPTKAPVAPIPTAGYEIVKIFPRPGGPTSQGWDCLVQVSNTVVSNFRVGNSVRLPGSRYKGTYQVFYIYRGKTVSNIYLKTKFVGDDPNARIVKL